MRRLCIYCGSSLGVRPEYSVVAENLGFEMAKRNIDLVYGGASIGIMGIIANAVLAHGGKVIGVIPQVLVNREVAHNQLTELKMVKSMHQRKALMAELSDGFIALPGGLGTLEELFETLTWAQLGLHQKPCGLLNVNDYYTALISFLNQSVIEGFVSERHQSLLMIGSDSAALLDQLTGYQAPLLEHNFDLENT